MNWHSWLTKLTNGTHRNKIYIKQTLIQKEYSWKLIQYNESKIYSNFNVRSFSKNKFLPAQLLMHFGVQCIIVNLSIFFMGQELRQVFLVLPSAEQIETNDEILIINVYTNFYFELGLVELKNSFQQVACCLAFSYHF